MLVYICFPVFSPFTAHFYPPLHHNGKGSIPRTYVQLCYGKACRKREDLWTRTFMELRFVYIANCKVCRIGGYLESVVELNIHGIQILVLVIAVAVWLQNNA